MYTIGHIVRDMQDVQDVKNAIESIEHWHCTIEEVHAKMRNVEFNIENDTRCVVYFDFNYDGIYFGYDYLNSYEDEADISHKCGTVTHNILELHSALGQFELKEQEVPW